MSILATTALVLSIALRIYSYFLWARLIIEWVGVLRPSFRPKGFVLVLMELVLTVTDPPIKLLRKILPPIRIGNIQLDLAWMITMFACLILIGLLS